MDPSDAPPLHIVCAACRMENVLECPPPNFIPRCANCRRNLPVDAPGVTREITAAEFEQEVMNCPRPVVIDFFSSREGGLRTIFEMVALEMVGRAKFVRISSKDNPDLAGRYMSGHCPQMVVFKGGRLVGRRTGEQSESSLRAFARAHCVL